MPNIDVTEIVRSTAGKYLGGDVSGMSKEDLVAQVKTLAGRTDQIQDMVKSQLGL
jgi:hypothetical protein